MSKKWPVVSSGRRQPTGNQQEPHRGRWRHPSSPTEQVRAPDPDAFLGHARSKVFSLDSVLAAMGSHKAPKSMPSAAPSKKAKQAAQERPLKMQIARQMRSSRGRVGRIKKLEVNPVVNCRSSVDQGGQSQSHTLSEWGRFPARPREVVPPNLMRLQTEERIQLDEELFAKNVRSARRGAAPGPSGMAAEHLFPLLGVDPHVGDFVAKWLGSSHVLKSLNLSCRHCVWDA